MKVRRPDAAKAAKQLERQHVAAAQRAAQVARQRRAPAGFRPVPDTQPLAEAMAQLDQRIAPVVERMWRAAHPVEVPTTFQGEAVL